LRVEGATVHLIGRLSGVTSDTVQAIADSDSGDGGREFLCTRSAMALMAVTPEQVATAAAWVPSRAVEWKLWSLRAGGWTSVALRAELTAHGRRDISVADVDFNGPLVRRSTADEIDWLFERLRDTPGGSGHAATRAARKGWRTPDHYDDEGNLLPHDVLSGRRDEVIRRFRTRLRVVRMVVDGCAAGDIARVCETTEKNVKDCRDRAYGVGLRGGHVPGEPFMVAGGQETRVGLIRVATDNLSVWERTEVLDDPWCDYRVVVARLSGDTECQPVGPVPEYDYQAVWEALRDACRALDETATVDDAAA
jgi:hypothetical protein